MEPLSIVLIIYIAGAALGALLGSRRQMGVVKGLLWGLFLNWLGWIVILVSPKPEGVVESRNHKKWKKIIMISTGVVLLLLAAVVIVATLTVPVPKGVQARPLFGIFLLGSVGCLVLKTGLAIVVPKEERNIVSSLLQDDDRDTDAM